MTRKETIQVITLLAGNYDNVAKKDKTQKELMINTWQECLGDLEYSVVLQAVKKCIIEIPYTPTIHDVRKNAIELLNPSAKRTGIEAWEEAYTAICNGLYMTKEQFDKYSPEVKSFFGDVKQVKELAQCNTEMINTVTKGQFLKQYETLLERKREQNLLPTQMKNIISQISSKMNIQQVLE